MKLTGPLLSLGASGSIAKTIVMGTYRGIPYARQHVIPANPRTTAQQLTRDVFAALDLQYKYSLALAQAPWKLYSKGKGFYDRNAFIGQNLRVIREEADMALFVASPGANGGLAGETPTAVGGGASGEIDATLDFGQAPADWSADSVTFMAFPDRDPSVLPTVFTVEASEAGPGDVYVPPQTVSHTFTGLTAGGDYIVSMFPVWTRADGLTAYGPSSTLQATATA